MFDVGMESTGDPELDAALLEAVRRRAGLLAEGICPNECGPIEQGCPGEVSCPACGWRGYGYR